MKWTLTWDEAAAAGAAEAGGKGWNLGRLHRYGFPVPHGFVVTAAAYRAHLAEAGLQDRLHEVAAVDPLAPETSERLGAIRAAITAADLPASVRDAVHDALGALHGPVAVRSSATAEDSAAASFAGIHRSLLNVQGETAVLDAIRACYASLWTEQAVAYRRKLGLADDEVSAAAVILEMVDARAAGVAFSCEPRTGRRDRYTISANWGLGESVVSGEADPDEYEIDPSAFPPAVSRVRLGRKQKVTRALPTGGTELVDGQGDAPVLTEEQTQELASLVGRVHDALGDLTQPQDIEWAFDGARFYLLQSRPVTRLPECRLPGTERYPTIWSNANLRDVMPGVQSPLNWTMFRHQVDRLMRTPFSLAGYKVPAGVEWIRLFQGRAYFNLTALQWGLYDALGFLPEETNRTLGGHQPALEVDRRPFRGALGARRLLATARTIAASSLALRRAPGVFKGVESWCRRWEAQYLDGLTEADLAGLLQEVRREAVEFIPLFQTLNGLTAGSLGQLVRTLKPIFGERTDSLVNGLLVGKSSVTSAEQGSRLVELGNLALREPAVRAWFSSPDWSPNLLYTNLTGTRWLDALRAYLTDFGHRSVYELEIAHPRWREDPSYLLEAVRSQVLAGREIHVEDRHEKRLAAEREVYGRIGRFSPRGLLVRSLVSQAARASEGREMGKSLLVRILGIGRLAVLEVGRRLVSRGLLGAVDDIFCLTAGDLEAILAGRPVGPLGALVADRRRLRARWEAEEPPGVIVGDSPGARAAATTPAGAVPLAGPVLRGLGVSGGRVTATARLVRHPHEGARLRQGEVLVAPSTDPAWTPLFLRASAVVTEVGGHLSHGSIVAREYGLPAVVNVPGAMAAIRDGETITVDGDSGAVARSEM